jgi:hypothetical protein
MECMKSTLQTRTPCQACRHPNKQVYSGSRQVLRLSFISTRLLTRQPSGTMAEPQQTSYPVATPKPETMTAPRDTTEMAEPRQPHHHTAATSPASSVQTEKVEKPEPPVDDHNDANREAKDNVRAPQKSAAPSEPEYPPPLQVAIIMTCILCAIFIMSLVSRRILQILIEVGRS